MSIRDQVNNLTTMARRLRPFLFRQIQAGAANAWVINEDHTDQTDGTVTQFPTVYKYLSGKLLVFMDGSLQRPGVGNAYTEDADQLAFTFAAAPSAGVVLLASYIRDIGGGIDPVTTLLLDYFTTSDAAPITAARPAEPGPGILYNTDSESKLSITGSQLVGAGGKASPAWGDPSLHFRTNSGAAFGRGTYFEFDLKITTLGYAQLGVSNSTTVGLSSMRHSFGFGFSGGVSRFWFEDVGNVNHESDKNVGEVGALAIKNVTYYFRLYVLTAGGFLLLMKGGQFGTTWRTMCYSTAQTDASLYPAANIYDMAFQLDNMKGYTGDPGSLYVAYYNGATTIGVDYAIGRAVSLDGISLGRDVLNPVLSAGAATTWDDVFVKDPWVLKDGATWRMWYSGYDGSNYRIGYATSADGRVWTKDGGNPVLDLGGGGTFDESALIFPIVYKDADADASKRWRMLYGGKSAAGNIQIGYAYAANPEGPWTKGASNPVVALGAGGQADDVDAVPGALLKNGSTYHLYYGMNGSSSFPADTQVGLVNFTDFEGTYTKSGSNPILSPRTGAQTLTANLAVDTTTVTIADTSGFVAGEYVLLYNNAIIVEQNIVASITDSTHLELLAPVSRAFTTAAVSKIRTSLRNAGPRTVVLEDGVWKMWGVTHHNGDGVTSSTETTFYATGTSAGGGWAFDYGNTPPLHLPCEGFADGWDSISAENIVFALDADTFERVVE